MRCRGVHLAAALREQFGEHAHGTTRLQDPPIATGGDVGDDPLVAGRSRRRGEVPWIFGGRYMDLNGGRHASDPAEVIV